MFPIIVWFRQDLRLQDNPAFVAAVKTKAPIIFLYIYDDSSYAWTPGAASKWWLYESLASLQKSILSYYHAPLVLKKGNPLIVLQALIQDTQASAIYWNRCYEPYYRKRDNIIQQTLQGQGMDVFAFNGSLLQEPENFYNQSKQGFKVFTPFWRKLQKSDIRFPLKRPTKVSVFKKVDSLLLKDLHLLPKHPWYLSLSKYWQAGEHHAHQKLKRFFKKYLKNYASLRNRPDCEHTSCLSPFLHAGEISVAQIWHACQIKKEECSSLSKDIESFLSELGWREFSYHLLYHFPQLPTVSFRSSFEAFAWKKDNKILKKWQKGLTGYPMIDAGMRQLWHTGWMHNRVRMLVASFLTKHLLLHWQWGEEWFWETLVDADLANNAASWQWVAGSGADAAPYFRIFNPVLQGKKFDPSGEYVKKWVPELKNLPLKYLHTPWEASSTVLKQANIVLGKTYPYPLIDHDKARKRALQAYKHIIMQAR